MSPYRNDLGLICFARLSALIAGAIVLFIVGFLISESLPIFKDVSATRFFTDEAWYPSEDLYNLGPMLYGTLLSSLGALLLATPLGVLSAIFCHYYASPTIASLYRQVIALLSGIPSVVYGLWGLLVLVPLIRQIQAPGASLLAGILILTLMILPTIALTADAGIKNVPSAYINNAAALGLSRWSIIRTVVLPASRPSILSGIILGAGRALGETMAILMVCGNIVQIPGSLFDPVRTLTANIALEMAYAMGDHRAALFVSGLVLFALIILLVAIVDWLNVKRTTRRLYA